MEAGHLDLAIELEFGYSGIGDIQEVVVVQEVGQRPGVDQQGGFHLLGIGVVQRFKLVQQVRQQRFRVCCVADHVSHLPAYMHGFGERAQVQADHGLFQPLSRGLDDGWLRIRIHLAAFARRSFNIATRRRENNQASPGQRAEI